MVFNKPILVISVAVLTAGVMFHDIDTATTQESQAFVDSIARGKALAETNCSRCHSVDLEGESSNVDAPTFRSLSSYREIGLIHWLLLEKTNTEHTEMPHFAITVEQTGDIVAWINWLQPIPRGKRLVQKNCSQCHAVDLYDESAHPTAPAFRNLSKSYPIHSLEEAFAEGIKTDHPDMPIFQASSDQLLDMLAYITTLQKPELE